MGLSLRNKGCKGVMMCQQTIGHYSREHYLQPYSSQKSIFDFCHFCSIINLASTRDFGLSQIWVKLNKMKTNTTKYVIVLDWSIHEQQL